MLVFFKWNFGIQNKTPDKDVHDKSPYR